MYEYEKGLAHLWLRRKTHTNMRGGWQSSQQRHAACQAAPDNTKDTLQYTVQTGLGKYLPKHILLKGALPVLLSSSQAEVGKLLENYLNKSTA